MNNLPPGVGQSDPHFYDDERPCVCGHVLDEHAGECAIDDCDCVGYEPDEDYEEPDGYDV